MTLTTQTITATAGSEPTTAATITDGSRIYGSGSTAVAALDGVTERFDTGRFTAIMGPSGSGKSTLLHCLAGLDTLTSGRVMVEGLDLGSLDDRHLTRLRRDRLGFVFQSFNLVPTLTAEENILLPLSIARRRCDDEWAAEIIGALGLGSRLSHLPSELSGGQQQRVAVARALMSRPALVLADEPSGNLDSRSGAEVLGFLREAVDHFGQTVVMVTHDPAAAALADRVIFLADGRVVDTMTNPTAGAVLDRMKQIGG